MSKDTSVNGVHLESWDELAVRVEAIRDSSPGRLTPLLFRGHARSQWSLQTTLERRTNDLRVQRYYGRVFRIRSEVQTFTGDRWEVPDWAEFGNKLRDYEFFRDVMAVGKVPAYEYLIYLRHHGFPSPLLDWSESLQIAGFFAAREAAKQDDFVIYVLDERPNNMKSGSSDRPEIFRCGPIVAGHKRHFLQQSTYTLCANYDLTARSWSFAPHEAVIQDGELPTEFPQDRIWKFIIPGSQRLAVMRKQAEYNLTAYSLFGTEESLMDTLAVREFDFRA